MRERQQHDAFSAWLNKLEIPFVHSRMDQATTSTVGDPDFFVLWMGRVLGIEFKVGKNKLSPAQQDRIAYLKRSGIAVKVAYGVEEAIEACKSILCIGNVTAEPQRGFPAGFIPKFKEMLETVAAVGMADVPPEFAPTIDKVLKDEYAAPADGKYFIGNLRDIPWVFEGDGKPGSQTRMIRKATTADLVNLKPFAEMKQTVEEI